jgi:quinol monooxygenase YgiN
MNELQGIARLIIHPGKLEEFKRLAVKCMESVRSKDTGTLQYDWFFSSDYAECLVYERYRDSEALLEHIANLGETMDALFETCSGSGEICGTLSLELTKALEGSPVRTSRYNGETVRPGANMTVHDCPRSPETAPPNKALHGTLKPLRGFRARELRR